jgi:type I restriction enzyme R subunit
MRPYEVYTQYHIDTVVELYLSGGARDKLDPHLDICAKNYRELDTDSQIKFKASAKDFVRTYGFLGAILPIGNPEWEKQSIFLNLLLPKLPSPAEDDLSQGILDAIDLDSYRAEVKAQMTILLEDSEAEVGPVPTGTASGQSEPELDLLTNILNEFNDLFGNINWNNVDNVRRQISRIPAMVANDKNYQNTMRNNDKQEARTVSERVLHSVMFQIMADNTELFKQYSDNPAFKKWLSDFVFTNTYNPDGREGLTFEVL